MKISPIVNNQSFNGVWVKSKTVYSGVDQKTKAKTYNELYIYHPFLYEDGGKTKHEIDKYDGKTVHTYNKNGYLNKISYIMAYEGSPLGITEEDYNKISSPEDSADFEVKQIVS